MKKQFVVPFAIITAVIFCGQTALGACSSAILPTPNVGMNGDGLSRVSGSSSGDVWAVGFNFDSIGLIEHFNGSTWTVSEKQPTPIADVTSLNPSDAWVVDVGRLTFERWNGATWNHVLGAPADQGDGALLNAISGNSANPDELWSVGSEFTKHGPFAQSWAFAEKWDGTTWTTFRPPGGLQFGELLAVSTTADGKAWAVGDETIDSSKFYTVVDHWNGTTWIRVPSAHKYGVVTGVYAVADDDVWTISKDNAIEHWDGHAWSIVPFTMPSGHLLAIYGSSNTDVWVVGGDFPRYSNETNLAFAAHWDGAAWKAVSTPNGDVQTELTGVYDSAGSTFMVGDAASFYTTPTRKRATFAVLAHC